MTKEEFSNIPESLYNSIYKYPKYYYKRKAYKRFKKQIEDMKQKRPGVIVILHHLDPNDTNYELFDNVIPMYTDEHTKLHYKLNKHNNWHHTIEAKERIRNFQKGRKHGPMSEETKKKISIAKKAKHNTSWNKGKHMSEETKKKVSEGLKKYFKDKLN